MVENNSTSHYGI